MAKYVITDGSSYIKKDKRGQYVPTTCAAWAESFSKDKAENVLNNQISKGLRKRYHVELYESDPPGIKCVTQTDIEKAEKVMGAENITRWLDRIRDLNGLAQEALQRKDQLSEQLSNVDKQLSDIEHYIEFSTLNAYQGYQAAKMIKDKRIIRRGIKNKLFVLNIILGKKISETAEEEILRCVEGLDNRKYSPRVLGDMFEM